MKTGGRVMGGKPEKSRHFDAARPLSPRDCLRTVHVAALCVACGSLSGVKHVPLRLIKGVFCPECCPCCAPDGGARIPTAATESGQQADGNG